MTFIFYYVLTSSSLTTLTEIFSKRSDAPIRGPFLGAAHHQNLETPAKASQVNWVKK